MKENQKHVYYITGELVTETVCKCRYICRVVFSGVRKQKITMAVLSLGEFGKKDAEC